jgi:type IV pilus assembly protein PilV
MKSHALNLHKQRGVGLIEILVAVLVLSIGLLGLAGLQLRTLRNNQSALERGMAVVETHALADALRADRTNARNGLFDLALTDPAPVSPTTFRAKALAAWRANLTTVLGAGATGSVDCNGTQCVIIVQWDDTRATGGTATYNVQTEVQI